MGLWTQLCGPQKTIGDPWLIHPAIVARIRRNLSTNNSVFFAEWSVMLDRDAMTIISSVAAWTVANADATLELVEFLDPQGPKAIADLSRLRAQLIEDSLVEAGVARERIGRGVRGLDETVGLTKESQRIDIVHHIAALESDPG
jgi:outer membrane protein OmpA-like peptidoglycan-associated protein